MFFSFLVSWWYTYGNGIPNLQMMDLLQVHPILIEIVYLICILIIILLSIEVYFFLSVNRHLFTRYIINLYKSA